MDGEPIITNVKPLPYEIPRPRNHVEAKPYEPLPETPYFREPTLAESLAAAWQTTKIIAVITPHIVKLITDELTAFGAIDGLGYVPDREPPAGPPGATPLIVMFAACVTRPFESTVN